MNPLSNFDPLIVDWFAARFQAPTEPQREGWPVIRSGADVLISAPTGAGKTLAAFLICLDGLVRAARSSLPDRVEVVYVSPLKALSNDVQKNLERPLDEIHKLAADRGIELSPIRTAVRTGDTRSWERRRMLDQPPHVLVTTPESLYILLTVERGRRALSTARVMIVDEIHAVAGSKRGSHLALSLARLEALVVSSGGRRPQRIGLSATVRPLEEVARFLSGAGQPPAEIVTAAGGPRPMDLAVEVPRDELSSVASTEMWSEIYDRLADLSRQHRTTLIFVSTRKLAERVAHHLGQRLGQGAVLPHHGSLSRRLRLNAEQRLKNGELRAVVATASLELGIDIGSVDLACLIGSPRSISTALQRVGRSGHWVGALPKGRLFATTRDELIECAAVIRAMGSGDLDRLQIPAAPLDILAQQLVAECACQEWAEDDLFALVRRAWPYAALEREDFDAVVEMVSEGIAASRGRRGAWLHHDRIHGRLRGRRGARLAAITCGGAIPDNANYQVVAEPGDQIVGTLDEDFAVESSVGDVFLLGTTSWRVRRIEQGRVRVEDARGAAPTIPFWRGEAPARTIELSLHVSRLREEILRRGDDAVEFLSAECGLDRRGAEQAAAYARAAAAALGAMPSQNTLVAERFFDEAGGMQLVLHAPFGARINRAWGLALRKRFCRAFNLELQAAATDNGLLISLTEQHAFPLETVFEFVKAASVERVLTQALLATPMFTVRWRWNGNRALAVLRFAGGRKVPPPIQRMRSDDLLAAVFPDQAACAENLSGEVRIPDHPLVRETIGDCLQEAMDLEGLREILGRLESGALRTVAVETAEPSPLSHEIVNSQPYTYLDDAPLEERRARAVQLRRSLPAEAAAAGALDPEAIRQVASECWPAPRDPDELHDALLTLVVLPPVPEWLGFFDALAAQSRASVLRLPGGGLYWVAAERAGLVWMLYPDGVFDRASAVARREAALPESREACAAQVAGGWLESSGPATAEDLAHRLGMESWLMEAALARLEAQGRVLRGRFTPQAGQVEWADRRLLARIHRLTLGRLRREIEPVSTADFVRFLARWQHVSAGAQLHGADGLLEVVRQLQGYEIPAAAWEAEILPRRVARYSADLLDCLCLAGEVMWGRLSPHRALETTAAGAEGNGASRRIRPNRIAPLSLFTREEAPALMALARRSGDVPALSPALSHAAGELRAELERRGASFFTELQRATGRLSSEVEDGLWELAAAGLVTADGFENLRALLDPKRRRGEGRGRLARPRHAAGRWALLARDGAADAATAVEAFAVRLLRRWGVVCRDLLARETLAPPWRDLLVVYRRLEARGEIRGGRFLAAQVGEHFALPEAVDLLRHVRRSAAAGEELAVSAADPLNLAGVILPMPRLNPLAGGVLRLRDGVPVEKADGEGVSKANTTPSRAAADSPRRSPSTCAR